MSLELAAQHLASRGRKGDTSLVHMAPQEVAGLQALAKAHGGSLTLNPDTGLPEAGFLSKLLPTLIGAGLSVASGGALTPLMAAGITGAGYGLASGSLSKGLMAGLGAYGGAGLAGGLTAAAGTVGAEAAAGASEMAATQAGLQQNALTTAGLPSSAAAGAGSMSFAPGMGTNVLGTAPLAGPMSVPVSAGQLAAGVPQVATATPMPAASSVAERFAQAGKGFGALGTEAGRDAFMGNAASKGVEASGVGGGMGLLKSGYAAATPLMMQEPAKQGPNDEEKPYEYDFDIGRVADPNAGYTGAFTGERKYFDPRFTRKAADGGLMGLGTVQAMSDRNMAETMAANGGQGYAFGGVLRDAMGRFFDRSDTARLHDGDEGYYSRAPFTTMPVSPAPITAMPSTNSAVRPVEENPFYTMSGQSGDAFKYLMGQAPASRGVAAPTLMPALPAAGETAEYDYTFDPVTNRYSRTAKPVAPVAAATPTDSAGGGGGDSFGGFGDSGGFDESAASNNAPVSNMGTDTGFGGDGANAGAPGGGNAAGGAGNSGDGGTGDSSTATDGGGGSDGSAGAAVSGEAGWAQGGIASLAQGGQVNLQGTFTAGDQGGGGQFGQANANGYQAAGSGGPIQGFSSSFGQMGGGQRGGMEAPSNGFENQQQALFGGLSGYGQAMRGLGNMGGFDPRAVQANPQGFAQHMAQMQQREQQMPGSTMMSDMRYRPERDDARIAANQANSNFASYAAGGMASMAQGGPSHLGDYSDGGRLLKGPGDGVSDSIPATIANKRPARLADGEFVVPARIVSELGNGSTEAGARKLYAMMDRIQKARSKTVGKNRVAVNSRSEKMLPA